MRIEGNARAIAVDQTQGLAASQLEPEIRPDTLRSWKGARGLRCAGLQIFIAAAEGQKIHAKSAAVDRSLTREIPQQGRLLLWRRPLREVLTGDGCETSSSVGILNSTLQQGILQCQQSFASRPRSPEQRLLHCFNQGAFVGSGQS